METFIDDFKVNVQTIEGGTFFVRKDNTHRTKESSFIDVLVKQFADVIEANRLLESRVILLEKRVEELENPQHSGFTSVQPSRF